jgi:uncharacterized protein
MLTTMLAVVASGFYAARFARLLPASVLRVFVVLLSATVTAGFFLRKY